MAHEDYKEMLPARALSALDTADNVSLNEHLLTCAECRSELSEWEAVSSDLALTADPIEPSPAVRERILNQVREQKKSPVAPETSSRVVPFATPKRNFGSTAASFALIAAGVVLAFLVGTTAFFWREKKLAEFELAKLKQQIEATQTEVKHQNEIFQFFTTPGAKVTELAGTSGAPGARATLAYDKTGRAMLLARGLPAAPTGKGYQLWFIVGNKPLPGHVFNTDESGSGTLNDQMPSPMSDKAIFAITMESSSGAQLPTGAILLRSEL
jgi:anti-sigma-K factor RskA